MILRNLFSAKQVGTLYHYTNYRSGENIVKENFMAGTDVDSYGNTHTNHEGWVQSAKHVRFISFTRDKNFHRVARLIGGLTCRFVVDGDKLSNNYKIVPFDFFYKSATSIWDVTNSWEKSKFKKNIGAFLRGRDLGDEMEELVLLKESQKGIPDFLKYVIRLDYAMEDEDLGAAFAGKVQKLAPDLEIGVMA